MILLGASLKKMPALWIALRALVLIGCFGLVAPETSQAQKPPPSPISTLSEANAWLRDSSNTSTVQGHISGIVIYRGADGEILIQEGSQGMRVLLKPGMPTPTIGDRVDIEASFRFNSTDAEAPVSAIAMKNLGPSSMPEPAKPWLIEALNGKNDRQWIEIEGVVMQARLEGSTLTLHMTDQSGWALATVEEWPSNLAWTNGWGAHLRLRGANIGRGNKAIRIPSPAYVTWVRPGAELPFTEPAANAVLLRQQPKGSPTRARLVGMVLSADSDSVFVRSGETALRASYLQPFSPGSINPAKNELIPAPIPRLAVGDFVELVGSPLRTKPYLTLNFSVFRLLGSNSPPTANAARASTIADGTSANDFVRVSGRLLSRQQITVNKTVVETLKLEDDSHEFQATLESNRGGQLSSLKTDDLIEITGLVTPIPGDPNSFVIRMSSASDARSLGLAPSVSRSRLWRGVGGVGALLLMAVSWIILLRRQVSHHTNQLKLANEKLQQEIEEGRRADKVQRATYAISEAVHTAGDLQSFYPQVHRIISGLMPAHNFFLLLHNPGLDLHEYVYHVDQKDPWPAARRVSGGLVGYILKSGTALLADHASMTNKSNEWCLVSGTPSAIWLGVPLSLHGQTIGVMALQDYENPSAYGEEEKIILTYVASQIALALERKRAEAALAASERELRQSEQRFRTAFYANPALMTVTRLDNGRFVAANAAFLQASGYTEQEVVGKLARDLNIYANPEQRQEFVDLLRRDGFVRDREHQLQTKSGHSITVLVTGEVIQLDGEPHTLSVGIDISTRKKAEQDMRRALAAERDLGELKSRFVSLVSHEFRTPLGITMSAVELLRNYLDRLPPAKLKELLEDIYSATLRMSGLMEQVLLLGRVEAGKISFKASPIDVASLGSKLVDEMHSATHRRCPIHLECEDDFAGACADEALIRHIFSNLLSNAVKYSPDASPVRFCIRRQGAHGLFEVIDQGIGIPEEDHDRLFEAFHRASNVGQISGTGLGLMIVKRCVDLHLGSIRFESVRSKGTRFAVTLPLFPSKA